MRKRLQESTKDIKAEVAQQKKKQQTEILIDHCKFGSLEKQVGQDGVHIALNESLSAVRTSAPEILDLTQTDTQPSKPVSDLNPIFKVSPFSSFPLFLIICFLASCICYCTNSWPIGQESPGVRWEHCSKAICNEAPSSLFPWDPQGCTTWYTWSPSACSCPVRSCRSPSYYIVISIWA